MLITSIITENVIHDLTAALCVTV